MRRAALVLMFLLVPTSLFAQSWRDGRPARYDRGGRDSAFELTPFLGYRYGGTIFADTTNLFGGDADVASNANFGVNFGIPIGDNGVKLALLVDQQNTHLTSGDGGDLFGSGNNIADMRITYYQAGAEIPFSVSRRSGVTPFFSLAAGVANIAPDVRGVTAANRFSASASIGVKIPINPNVAVRIEERGFYANTGSSGFRDCGDCFGGDTNLYQGETNVGVTFRF